MNSRRWLAVGPLPPPINGMSKAFRLLVDGLREGGLQIEVLDTADRSGRRGGSFAMDRARDLAELVATVWRRQWRCDGLYLAISQSRLGFLKDTAAMAPALVLGRPIVVHLHGGNFRAFYDAQPAPVRAMIRTLLAKVQRIVVLSPEMRADFNMVPNWEERTVTVLNATDLPRSTPRSAPGGELRVLFLSNLLVQKGYLDVLEAVQILGERRPDLRVAVDFAGAFKLGEDQFSSTDAMETDFRARVGALPPNVDVAWHGVVDGPQKLALLDGANVFALPTYYVNEGQPISIIEAMARGLPVISTDHRGIRHMLPASQTSLFVARQAPDQIAKRLEELMGNRAGYEQMSRDSLARAQDFSNEAHLSAMRALLIGALEGRG